MTPMFSAYVVVGEPPTEVAMTVPTPSATMRATHVRVEVGLGHLGDRLDVAGVLGDQGDHGRQHEQDEREVERREVPADDVGSRVSVCGGNPNQGADETPSQLTRKWVVTLPAAASYDVIGPKPLSKTQERV